jgi:L-lactate dehydrogenase complex protein LldG
MVAPDRWGYEMSARDDILGRIRTALADVPDGETPGDVAVPRDYRRSHVDGDVIELFIERVADYRATVTRVTAGAVAAEISRILAVTTAVVVPAGFPAEWLPDRGWLSDDPTLATADLDRVEAALTTAALGIALTGTIVLDAGPGQGRRALTLIPDVHLCVIRADQIIADVPDALAHLDATSPLTLISGPSATSDIELQRVEGVHGPRNLHVIVVEEASA